MVFFIWNRHKKQCNEAINLPSFHVKIEYKFFISFQGSKKKRNLCWFQIYILLFYYIMEIFNSISRNQAREKSPIFLFLNFFFFGWNFSIYLEKLFQSSGNRFARNNEKSSQHSKNKWKRYWLGSGFSWNQ